MLLGIAGVVSLGLGGTSGVTVDGPPPAHTGGFGEPTCAECHLGSEVNAPGSTLEVVGLGREFLPGRTYALTVRLRSFDMLAAGFQAAVRYAEGPRLGESAGRLLAEDARVKVTRSEAGVDYASHSRIGTSVRDEVAEWAVLWHAPEDEVLLRLDLAANSGNGDNSPLDDLVYTLSAELAPSVSDDAARHHGWTRR